MATFFTQNSQQKVSFAKQQRHSTNPNPSPLASHRRHSLHTMAGPALKRKRRKRKRASTGDTARTKQAKLEAASRGTVLSPRKTKQRRAVMKKAKALKAQALSGEDLALAPSVSTIQRTCWYMTRIQRHIHSKNIKF